MHTSPSAPSPPPAADAAPAWRAEGSRMCDGRFATAAILDLDAPQRGVRPPLDLAPGGAAPRAGALGVHGLLGVELRPSFRITDHWQRGTDVTAAYESMDDRRLRVTAMWRLHAAEADVRAWELVLSAQTAVLQSDPRLAVVSRVAFPAAAGRDAVRCVWGTCAGDGVVWHDEATPRATVVLLLPDPHPADGEALVVVGHPGEVERLAVRRDDHGVVGHGLVVEARLFAGELEKGVLLRGRVLAAVGLAADAQAWAGRLARAFAAAAPLLST